MCGICHSGSSGRERIGTRERLTWSIPHCPQGAGHWVQSTLWAVVALGAGSIEGKGDISLGCGADSTPLTVVAS